jgi:hypothetical protein
MDFCIGTCAKIDQVALVKQAEDAEPGMEGLPGNGGARPVVS